MPANSSLAARRSSTLPLTTLMSALSPAETLACGVACQGSNGTRVRRTPASGQDRHTEQDDLLAAAWTICMIVGRS